MAYTLVQFMSGIQMVVKGQYIIDNRFIDLPGVKDYIEVRVVGKHSDYTLLNNICIQNNTRSFVVLLNKEVWPNVAPLKIVIISDVQLLGPLEINEKRMSSVHDEIISTPRQSDLTKSPKNLSVAFQDLETEPEKKTDETNCIVDNGNTMQFSQINRTPIKLDNNKSICKRLFLDTSVENKEPISNDWSVAEMHELHENTMSLSMSNDHIDVNNEAIWTSSNLSISQVLDQVIDGIHENDESNWSLTELHELDESTGYLRPITMSNGQIDTAIVKNNEATCTSGNLNWPQGRSSTLNMDNKDNENIIAISPKSRTPVLPSRRRKKNVCKYCKKKIVKIPQHLQQKHSQESDVQEYLTLPKNHPRRQEIINCIRREGNFQHFMDNKTEVVPARMLHKKIMDPKNYLPCVNCKILVTKGALSRHYKKCTNISKLLENNVTSRAKALALSLPYVCGVVMKNFILPKLCEGYIKETICYDRMILIYGDALCEKYRSQHHYAMIRNKLRLTAKILLTMKENDPDIDDVESILDPRYFDKLIACINKLGQYDENKATYLKPTIPTTIGTIMKVMIDLYITECIKNRWQEKKERGKELLHLLTTCLPSRVNKTATESLLDIKRHKPVVLPTTDDIKLFNNYVLKHRDIYFEQLLTKPFFAENWNQLSKFTLISILIFNRRRPGELERIHLADLKSIRAIDPSNNETFQQLSPEGKRALNQYVRFVIRGKLARGVPVLLHSKMYECIELLIKHTDAAKIHPKNPYLFALPQVDQLEVNIVYRHLQATDLIRLYSTKCEASNPKSLRATLLRKHVATKSVSLNLPENEISCLQNFLGHADKIHREYYRLPVVMDDIITMSKVFNFALGETETQSSTKRYITNESTKKLPEEGGFSVENNGDNDEESICSAAKKNRANRPKRSSKQLHEFEDLYNNDSNEVDGISAHKEDDMTNRLITLDELKSIDHADSSDYLPSGCDSSEESSDDEKKMAPMRHYVPRRTWSTPEKHAVSMVFENHIKNRRVPTMKECISAISENPCLSTRSAPQMISWVQHRIRSSGSTEFLRYKKSLSKSGHGILF
ncbi:unnamed protein product [Phaedon cochleariae]|uniref:Uncharacterized protein n=1 Tax=Phaedon cochleariae TaxID=80249 RepID=A0A9N9X3I8_PHACE|nr:unnamed protein product [Phaedon cochleariae]